MSRLAQEMINTILNGTNSVAHTKQKTPNPRQCSHCGSTAQVYVVDTEFEEQGDHIVKYTTYGCGCKHLWLTSTVYKQEGEEHVEDFVV